MVEIQNGWVQWDYQSGCYRGEVGGTLTTGGLWPEAWAAQAGVDLTVDQAAELISERDSAPLDFDRWPDTGTPLILTKTKFLRRLAAAEMGAILTAAKVSVEVEVLLFQLQQCAEVDLRDTVLAGSLAQLEQASLLAAGRAYQITGRS